MNKSTISKSLAAVMLAATFATPGFAQTPPEASKRNSASERVAGEIRKIDKEGGKLTIKHGEIKSLDMPGMTMVFHAKDKAMLDAVKVGDDVMFSVVREDGKMVVTELQPAK